MAEKCRIGIFCNYLHSEKLEYNSVFIETLAKQRMSGKEKNG